MRSREEHVRVFCRGCVRSGLLTPEEVYDEVVLAIRTELPASAPEADDVARAWIEEFTAELRDEQATWPEQTDYDRLQAAFDEIAGLDVVVLQGCDDHWSAKAVLDEQADDPPRGVAWFTPPDVWHAIDDGMLEVNLWHGTTANVAPGDALLDDVIAAFKAHELKAHYDEGRIEVAARWQRRLS